MKNVLLIIASFIIVVLFCEAVVYRTGLDMLVVRKILYFQAADAELFQSSRDPERLYELKPGSSALFPQAHVKEIKYTQRQITVNDLGFRGQAFARVKPQGVFRIVVFGGSNTCGALVNDEDTYPALMQQILDRQYPGKFEVWNAGLHAYVLSQDVAYAEYVYREFSPDLVIIQHTNQGRRPFHVNSTLKELQYLFQHNPALYLENIPQMFSWEDPNASGLHQFLAVHSGLYRILCTVKLLGATDFKRSDMGPTTAKDRFRQNNNYAEAWSQRRYDEFRAQHKTIPVISFYINGPQPDKTKENNVFVLDSAGLPAEYQEIHPPSYVYARYARQLCEFLIRNGYLPLG